MFYDVPTDVKPLDLTFYLMEIEISFHIQYIRFCFHQECRKLKRMLLFLTGKTLINNIIALLETIKDLRL